MSKTTENMDDEYQGELEMTLKESGIFTRSVFRTKEIEAVRLQLSNVIEIHKWCGGDPMKDPTYDPTYNLAMLGYIWMDTVDGHVIVGEGDWLYKNAKDEIFVIPHALFSDLFSPIDEE